MFKHSLSPALELTLHAEFSSLQLCLLLSLHCSLSCCVAFFSCAYIQSCYIALLCLFFFLHFLYYFLTFYLFSTLCPSCTSLCSSLCVLISTSQGFIAWIDCTCGFLAQIAFSPSNLSFFHKPSLFPLTLPFSPQTEKNLLS